MGNLVSFRCGLNAAPREPIGNSWPQSPKNNPPEPVQTLPAVDNITQQLATRTFRGLTSFVHGAPRGAIFAGPDAYTLVLLADQELHAGRDGQAETLLSEAYVAFDRQANGACGEAAH